MLSGRAATRLSGAAFIVVLIFLLVLAAKRPDPFADTYSVRAVFDDATGIALVDRDIRVAGVNVGKIGEVKRVGDDAEVELVLQPDIVVHTDASATLRPHTLFEGSDFVDLFPGSPSAPLMKQDGEIPRRRTAVYVSLDAATRVLEPRVRDSLSTLVTGVAGTLRAEGKKGLRKTLGNVAPLTKDLGPTARALQGPRSHPLSGALAGLADTVRAVSLQRGNLVPLVRSADRTIGAVDTGEGAALDAALAALPGSLAEVRRSAPPVTGMISALDAFAVAARPAAAELGPTIRAIRPLLRDAPPVLARVTPLLRRFGTITRLTAASAPGLIRLLSKLTPGVQLMDLRVTPALVARSQLGLPAYLQLLAALEAGTGAERPYQTTAQGTLGAGHIIRLGGYFDQTGAGSIGIAPKAARAAEAAR